MSDHPVKRRKKLIEVAIPLEAINQACSHEKSVRSSHLSSLHMWWARRPLAAARAILLCQLIDDPGEVPEEHPTLQQQDLERIRIFHLISAISEWDNCGNPALIESARKLVERSWQRYCEDNNLSSSEMPPVHDPFAGGGAIPFEAQRLGHRAIATDLNPVPVLLNKASLETPFLFKNASASLGISASPGALDYSDFESLIRHYGEKLKICVHKEVGNLWPEITVCDEEGRTDLSRLAGLKTPPIAWIWCRTVETVSPAFRGVHVPLVKSFCVSQKKGKEVWVKAEYRPGQGRVSYEVCVDSSSPITKGTVSRSGVKCIASGDTIPLSHVREQAKKGLLGRLWKTQAIRAKIPV